LVALSQFERKPQEIWGGLKSQDKGIHITDYSISLELKPRKLME
jgi:L-rhamnose mutarotase